MYRVKVALVASLVIILATAAVFFRVTSVFSDEAAWQAAERKLLKSCWPTSSAAASAMAALSSGTGTCQTRPRSSAGGARRFRIR